MSNPVVCACIARVSDRVCKMARIALKHESVHVPGLDFFKGTFCSSLNCHDVEPHCLSSNCHGLRLDLVNIQLPLNGSMGLVSMVTV